MDNPPPFDAALFDLDGVLIDSEPVSARAMRDAARRFGFDVPDEAMPTFKGLPGNVVYARVASEFGAGLVTSDVLRAVRDGIYETRLPGIPAMPGADALVEALHGAGCRLALVTSSRRRQAETALHARGWRDRFDVVVGAEDVARTKPDPEPFLAAARGLAIPPERCIVIEDSAAGAASGAAAGCHVIGLASSLSRSELVPAGAAVVLASHAEIMRYLGLG